MVRFIFKAKGLRMNNQMECYKITDFKAHCLQIIKNVHDAHKECLVTKHGKPFVKVVAVEPEDGTIFGCMKGTGKVTGDIFSTDETWDAER